MYYMKKKKITLTFQQLVSSLNRYRSSYTQKQPDLAVNNGSCKALVLDGCRLAQYGHPEQGPLLKITSISTA